MFCLYLDKNFNPRLVLGIMTDLGYTQTKTQVQTVDGVLILDHFMTITEAKLKFGRSEAEQKEIEHKLKYAVRTSKIKYEKGEGKTDPVKIRLSDIEDYLREAEVNLGNTQASNNQIDLVLSLRETNDNLKSQIEFLQKQLENKDKQIASLGNSLSGAQVNLNNSQELLRLEKQEKLLLEQKLAQENPPKKGFWRWFD